MNAVRVTITYANRSQSGVVLLDFNHARAWVREHVSFSGGAIAKIEAADDAGNAATLYNHSWNDESNAAALKDVP